ncbi:uncharacterized protein LOC113646151 [Tachysurus fulvidraco]|uniref:uncharacterized protein LOC113646151 n=1 Tax=Tachysurus fulvidraco TaxID=1234273 RepID=UPI001FED7C22|nr:uncharacterized protein LOC113646151 [Tachysurus fulvidraco]
MTSTPVFSIKDNEGVETHITHFVERFNEILKTIRSSVASDEQRRALRNVQNCTKVSSEFEDHQAPNRALNHSTKETRKKDHKIKSANSMKEMDKDQQSLQEQLGNSCPKKPARFVSEDFRKQHSDDIEALAWSIFSNSKENKVSIIKYKDKFPDMYKHIIIHDLQLEWGGKDYIWKEFNLLSQEDDINCVLDNCYILQSSDDIRNLITHYARVGEKDPKYIMINRWIYKLYPNKFYVFLVGKQLIRTENADEIRSVIEDQCKKYRYEDMREGIRSCKENNKDLNDVYVEYAHYARDTLQGIYTHGHLDPCKEAWFTTYFIATMISESIRNFRSFITTLMTLDLSLSENPEFLLEKLPMARGGSWINSDKRGFYGASTPVHGKKTRLKKLIEDEEEIFKKWILHRNKSEIGAAMIICLLELVYGKLRLRTDPSLLETCITNYVHFKKEIKSKISPEILRGSHGRQISLQNMNLSLSSLITHYPHGSFFMSVMCNYSSENIQNLNLYLYGYDLDWCGDESHSPLKTSVQTSNSNVSINPDVLSSVNMWILFHQHFSTDPVDFSSGLWKKNRTLHFTNLLKAEALICLHLNSFFSKFIQMKVHVYIDSVKQQHLSFLFLPSESLLEKLLKSPHRFFISNATHKITHSHTSLNTGSSKKLHFYTTAEDKRFNSTITHLCLSPATQFHGAQLLSDNQQLKYGNLYGKEAFIFCINAIQTCMGIEIFTFN